MANLEDKPSNPLIFPGDKWVYEITNIRESEPDEDGNTYWVYDVLAQIPINEYLKQTLAKHEAYEEANDEAILEMDADICNILDIIGGEN